MVKVLSFSFELCFCPFTMLPLEGYSETGVFFDIYLTTFFGVGKFKNTSSIRVILFKKIFKIDSRFLK